MQHDEVLVSGDGEQRWTTVFAVVRKPPGEQSEGKVGTEGEPEPGVFGEGGLVKWLKGMR